MKKLITQILEKTGVLPRYIMRRTLLRHRAIRREILVCLHISGEGLEIGALHKPTRVYGLAKVRYLDRLSNEELRRQYPELDKMPLVNLDYVGDGELLETVPDASQDFVIINHFIEHCRNPLLAMKNIFRVLRPGGVVLGTVPDMRKTFDKKRQTTDFAHLKADYENGPDISERDHCIEWVCKVEDRPVSEADKRADEIAATGYSIHYHAWDSNAFLSFLASMSEMSDFNFETAHFGSFGEEILFVLKKM